MTDGERTCPVISGFVFSTELREPKLCKTKCLKDDCEVWDNIHNFCTLRGKKHNDPSYYT